MLEIAKEDVLRSLEYDNPWWQNHSPPPDAGFAHSRAYFQRFKEIALNWNVRRAVILMGPRRVGKTVMLRQLIGAAIKDSFPPERIVFASLDSPIYSSMPLEKLLTLHEERTRSRRDDKRIVIFDEIQYLKEWEIHLKVLTDRHPATRFIASGSSAAALRLKSHESGAGRFTDFFLPPLTFAEFLNFLDLEGGLIAQRRQASASSYEAPDIVKLNAAFIDYLNYGGYPEAVVNAEIRKNARRYLGRDIIDKVLLRDLPSLYGIQDIQELNRLFATLAYNSGQEISLDMLSSNSGVSKNTINRYLEYLEAAFLIVRIRRVDETGRTFQRMRQFKVYLTNPSMRAALYAPVADGDDAMGPIVETAIFSQWFHSDALRNLHYARWKKGRQDLEVDLVHVLPSTLSPDWACEIKWSDRFIENPEQLLGLAEFSRKNPGAQVSATTKTKSGKTTSGGVEIMHTPCALQCYQVGRTVIEGHSM